MRIASSLHFVDVISGYVFRRIGSVVNFDDWLFEMPQVIVNRLGKDCTNCPNSPGYQGFFSMM